MCFRPFCRIFNFPNHYFAAPLTIFALDPPRGLHVVAGGHVSINQGHGSFLIQFNGKIRIDPDLALV